MITLDTTSRSVRFGRSPTEVAEYLNSRPQSWARDEGARADRFAVNAAATFPQAMKMLAEGWTEGARLVEHELHALIGTNAPGLNKTRWDVAGAEPDVARYLGGEMRCMRRRIYDHGNRPIVHLIVNTALSGVVEPEQATNYGLAIAGVVDLLERTGRRVELDRVGVVHVGNASNSRSLQGWKVKHAEDPMDLAMVAFAIAHPSSHRRIVWTMRETCLLAKGYGAPAELTKQDALDIGADDDAFLLDSVGRDWDRCKDKRDALKLAVERINKQAGEELVSLELDQ